MGCGDWVIGSGRDIVVRLVVSLNVVCVFIVLTIYFLMLTVISFINIFILSFICFCTSIIMVVRRSFIIPDIWSFQFSDFSESERFISSWVFSVVVLWVLSLYSAYSLDSIDRFLEPRHLPLPPPYLAYAPLSLPPFKCCWSDDGYPVENL